MKIKETCNMKEIDDILRKPVDKKILQNAKLLLKDHINIDYL